MTDFAVTGHALLYKSVLHVWPGKTSNSGQNNYIAPAGRKTMQRVCQQGNRMNSV